MLRTMSQKFQWWNSKNVDMNKKRVQMVLLIVDLFSKWYKKCQEDVSVENEKFQTKLNAVLGKIRYLNLTQYSWSHYEKFNEEIKKKLTLEQVKAFKSFSKFLEHIINETKEIIFLELSLIISL